MPDEFDVIAALRPHLDDAGGAVVVGPDDDGAVVATGEQVVVAVDTMVDGVHFDRAISSYADVGWKALAVNVSDVAAMGAAPLAAVVSLQRSPDVGTAEAEQLYAGLAEGARRWGCRLVGGDTVSSEVLAVSVTILGTPIRAGRVLRRSAAEAGDLVGVVGELGLAAAGLALARAGATDVLDAHPELLAAHRRPEPQHLAAAPLVLGGAAAAIDVSDGLGRDLAHIARMSQVRIRLDSSRLPVTAGTAAAAAALGTDPLDWVLGGGDDYALAVTVPGERVARLEMALAASGLGLRIVGRVEQGPAGVELDDGRDLSGEGWSHA